MPARPESHPFIGSRAELALLLFLLFLRLLLPALDLHDDGSNRAGGQSSYKPHADCQQRRRNEQPACQCPEDPGTDASTWTM